MKIKIVATIGPASGDFEIQEEMVKAGLNCARFNFSHGNYDEFKRWTFNLRKIAQNLNRPLAIMQDLQGPRIRVGSLEKEVLLKEGDIIKIGFKEGDGDIFLDNSSIFEDLKPKERILFQEGEVEVLIKEKDKTCLIGEVIRGGKIEARKGANFPDSKLNLSSLGHRDEKDALYGLELGVDYVALSFVRKAEDIEQLRKFLALHTKRPLPKIIAKIEKREAVDNIESILKAADGIMVARGDLGIEIPREHVPLIQKELVNKARAHGKLVIIATQMLESMIHRPIPTRAEVSDVANAILDGADSVMLSEETSVGNYPVESVEQMAKIIKHTEKFLKEMPLEHSVSEVDVLGKAACGMALRVMAKYIVCVTNSGYTALMISKHRPPVPIIALTPFEQVYRQLSLVWGIEPKVLPLFHTTDELIFQSVDCLKKYKLVKPKDKIIILAGHPAGEAGHTNLLKMQTID